MIDAAQARQFHEQGYLVARGALDPEEEGARLATAFDALVGACGRALLASAPAALARGFDERPLPERLAIGIGLTGGELLAHLDPPLQVGTPGYRHRRELPPAQIPELFAMMRAPRLLDLLEDLLGPEIDASPNYHLNFKLGQEDLRLARKVARASGRSRREPAFYNLQVKTTPWHMDAPYGLPDSWDSRVVIAWVALSESRERTGCLRLIPGSHARGVRYGPFADSETRDAIAIEARPGDVILMDNKMVHGSTQNTTDRDFRWSFNFRYAPHGQPTGRPYLPGFVARSRAAPERELRDAALWGAAWRAALVHASAPSRWIPGPGPVAPPRAEAVARHWRERIRGPEDWLSLAPARGGRTRSWISQLRGRV